MFGRSIQVSMVKPPTTATDDDTDFNDKATVISACVDSAIKKTAIAVVAYVAMDTARKVIVARATQGAS